MFSARRTHVQRALESTSMGIVTSLKRLDLKSWLGSPHACWRTVIGQGRAFCQDQISAEAPCANNLHAWGLSVHNRAAGDARCMRFSPQPCWWDVAWREYAIIINAMGWDDKPRTQAPPTTFIAERGKSNPHGS